MKRTILVLSLFMLAGCGVGGCNDDGPDPVPTTVGTVPITIRTTTTTICLSTTTSHPDYPPVLVVCPD